MRVTAYHDLDSPATMRADARAAVAQLQPAPRTMSGDRAVTDLYAAWPHDAPKPQLTVSEAARRLADALELHLD